MEKRPVIIVGSGPAGLSTALSLRKVAPNLASELLILEKAKHPRPKLCGGGLTVYGEEVLDYLDVPVSVPSFPIHMVRFQFGPKPIVFSGENLMRILRRDEFDASLVAEARERGIEIQENQRVLKIFRRNGAVEVHTTEGRYETKVLVGADGANSLVRRKLVHDSPSRVSRLVEALIKVDPEKTEEYRSNLADFDFRLVSQGVHGYFWKFPSFINEEAYLNVGVFDSGIRNGQRLDLGQTLRMRLQRDMPEHDPQVLGHPERWFHSQGAYASPNVLLVGDAAGVEPWLGEGISFALAYGPIAAAVIHSAFENGDFQFNHYKNAILSDKLGKLLERNRSVAKWFYRQPSQAILSKVGRLWEASFNRRLKTEPHQDESENSNSYSVPTESPHSTAMKVKSEN